MAFIDTPTLTLLEEKRLQELVAIAEPWLLLGFFFHPEEEEKEEEAVKRTG